MILDEGISERWGDKICAMSEKALQIFLTID